MNLKRYILENYSYYLSSLILEFEIYSNTIIGNHRSCTTFDTLYVTRTCNDHFWVKVLTVRSPYTKITTISRKSKRLNKPNRIKFEGITYSYLTKFDIIRSQNVLCSRTIIIVFIIIASTYSYCILFTCFINNTIRDYTFFTYTVCSCFCKHTTIVSPHLSC